MLQLALFHTACFWLIRTHWRDLKRLSQLRLFTCFLFVLTFELYLCKCAWLPFFRCLGHVPFEWVNYALGNWFWKPMFDSWVGKICWRRDRLPTPVFLGFPCGSACKESACNARDLDLIPGLGRSPGEGKGYLLQYSGLENSMDFIVHGVSKSQTQLSDFHFHFIKSINPICVGSTLIITSPKPYFSLDISFQR